VDSVNIKQCFCSWAATRMLISVSRIPPEFGFSLSLSVGFRPIKSNFPLWAQNAKRRWI